MPMVQPATPLALGLVGKVAHCRKNTIGTSNRAKLRLAHRATRSERRLAQKTPARIAQ
jgi:hypothetical protein